MVIKKQLLPYCLIIPLIVLLIYQCESNKQIQNISEVNTIALSDTVTYFKNQLGSRTASIKTLRLEQEQFNNLLLQKDKELASLAKEFKTLQSVEKYKSVMQIDTIHIPFDRSLDSLPRFELSGSKYGKWYSLKYKVNNDSLVLSSFKAFTETAVLTGVKKKWFLGKDVITTDITNSNPYIKVTDITSAQIIITQPWYKKWYVWLAAGLTGGLLLK